MGNPRKPTAILKASGALHHDKKRYADRAKEPKPNRGIGKPPAGMSEAAQKEWRTIVREMADGVLMSSDRSILRVLATLLAQFYEDPVEFPPGKLTAIGRLAGQLGMTPVDRTRIIVAPPKAKKSRLDAIEDGLS